jgi:hypothetical protein
MAVWWVAIAVAWIVVRRDTTGYVLGACWLVGGLGWIVSQRVPKNDE